MRTFVCAFASLFIIGCGDHDYNPDIRMVPGVGDCQWVQKLTPQGHWENLGNEVCSGEQGERGYDGVKGDTGAKGDKGDTGAQGVAGKDGTNGKDGLNGRDGRDGVNGINGVNGVNGGNGVQGERGADGVDGKDGAQGVQGVAGEKGETGAQGDPGKDAAVWVCTIGKSEKYPEILMSFDAEGKRWFGSFSDKANGENTRWAEFTNSADRICPTDGSYKKNKESDGCFDNVVEFCRDAVGVAQ